MSIETWKAEFYPIPVGSPEYRQHMLSTVRTERDLAAATLAHSLHKWRGFKIDMVRKHGGRFRKPGELVFRDGFTVMAGTDTCALCVEFRTSYILGTSASRCSSCPLTQKDPSMECGRTPFGKDPWSIWCHSGNAQPMITFLEKELARVEGFLLTAPSPSVGPFVKRRWLRSA